MSDPSEPAKSNNWFIFAILFAVFAVFVPMAYKYGQTIARDGMDKALEEKARMDAELKPGLTARAPVGEKKVQKTEAGGTVVWYELGSGTPVVMFASAGREASDFNELAASIVEAGYKAVLVEAPGINGAVISQTENPTLFTLADDAIHRDQNARRDRLRARTRVR